MINAIQDKLNSTRQCNAILGRGNFCIVSLAFVSSFSPVGIVLKVGERARSSQTDSLWLTATTADNHQEQQETQLSFAAGLEASVKVGDKDDVSDC